MSKLAGGQPGNDNRSKYDPKFCKQLIEHMAAGCSFATFGAKVMVKYSTLKRWEKLHPEFADASEIGQLVCMYTWEKIIVGQATGSVKGLPATTIFALKNYFPDKFKENLSLTGAGNTIVVFDSGVPIKADQIENKNGIVETVGVEILNENGKTPCRRDLSSEEKIEKFSPNLPDFLKVSPILEISEDDI